MKQLITFLLLTIATTSWADRKALLIGNANYQSRPLKNPLNDVSKLTDKLQGLGFEVTALSNLSRKNMRTEIRNFGKTLNIGDESLFYYSGHGAQVDGQNYLLPLGNSIQTVKVWI